MEPKCDKMEKEKQKPILDYISLCNNEKDKIKSEKKENQKISIIITIYNQG